MTNQELIRLLKANSYKRIALDNDTGEPKIAYQRHGQAVIPYRATVAKSGTGQVRHMRNREWSKFPGGYGLS